MSRTRQKYNEQILYLFKLDTTDSSNHITNTYNTIGQPFQATQMGERIKEELDVLSGRVLRAQTLTIYKTRSTLDFAVGDNIGEIPNANELQQSTIVRVKQTPINQRGGKHNTTRTFEYTIEVS